MLLLALVIALAPAYAQKPGSKPAPAKGDPSSITGGLGMTWIDGQAYYLISLAPELAFGKFGVGLDLNLRISSKDQKIRKEDFNETYDYLRIIRYIRWGHKGDPVYARLGALDYSILGHGLIMYLYNNSPSYDDRRVGAEFDLDFGKYGFESVYSDFVRSGVFGLRGYVRPLQFTPAGKIPIIGGLEVGATYAGDFRSDTRDVSVDTSGGKVKPRNSGGIGIVGVDIGLPLLRIPTVSSTLYLDHAQILSYGQGSALGLQTDFTGLGLVSIFTKFERRWSGDHFIANYFDALYEIERYELSGPYLHTKVQELDSVLSPGPGFFGDLTVSILGKLMVRGTYQKLDKQPESGILHLGTSTADLIPSIVAEAGYDKKYIRSNKDIFTLDDRSLLYASLGYKPYPFMIVSTVYMWTFVPVKDANGNVSYKTQKQITPKISLVFPL